MVIIDTSIADAYDRESVSSTKSRIIKVFTHHCQSESEITPMLQVPSCCVSRVLV